VSAGACAERVPETAAAASSRRPVTVLPLSAGSAAPVPSRSQRTEATLALGRAAQMSAAVPATCGDAIEVPSSFT
jgi:hypothetical protein